MANARTTAGKINRLDPDTIRPGLRGMTQEDVEDVWPEVVSECIEEVVLWGAHTSEASTNDELGELDRRIGALSYLIT